MFREAKSVFQAESIDQTRLEITIEPSSNINVFIDGQLKAKSSPYKDATISYGQHILAVSAPGYYKVEMPIEIKEGQKVAFPLILRAQQNAPVNGDKVDEPAPAPKPKKAKAEPQEPLAPTADFVEAVEERNPVTVRVGLDPECTIFIDGAKSGKGSSMTVVLRKSSGSIKVRFDAESSMDFNYRISKDGNLSVKPKGTLTGWLRNGSRIEKDKFFLINLQPQRFEAVIGPDNVKQAAVFKAIDN